MRDRLLLAYRRLALAPRLKARIRSAILRALPSAFPRTMQPGHNPREISPTAPISGKPDYLVFGVIDWHLRLQRPQHLAVRLAQAGHRVFYISSNLIPRPGAGFRVEPLGETGRLFQVHLQAVGVSGIYYGAPGAQTTHQMEAGLRALLSWSGARELVLLVDHPFWASTARALSRGLIVYDRMDYHAGFAGSDWPSSLAAEEERLIRSADLTVVTSTWLDERTPTPEGSRVLIRNAGDWLHFAESPPSHFSDPRFERVLGYYGAIAPWLDLDLIEETALAFPDSLLLLIGHDQAGATRRLRKLPNVRLTGEVAYDRLPFFLYGFDVCLLPFRRIDLTLATNPVKVYEYLSAGLPIVATELPELEQFGDLLRVARDRNAWMDAIRSALQEPPDHPIRRSRQRFAASQTWDARAQALMDAVEARRQRRNVDDSR